jgi:hypothetical protein
MSNVASQAAKLTPEQLSKVQGAIAGMPGMESFETALAGGGESQAVVEAFSARGSSRQRSAAVSRVLSGWGISAGEGLTQDIKGLKDPKKRAEIIKRYTSQITDEGQKQELTNFLTGVGTGSTAAIGAGGARSAAARAVGATGQEVLKREQLDVLSKLGGAAGPGTLPGIHGTLEQSKALLMRIESNTKPILGGGNDGSVQGKAGEQPDNWVEVRGT